MKTTVCPKIFIYTALSCEAKSLIDFYRLKKNISIQPFAVYSSGDICLTITGIGKNAMAAGVAYTQALFSFTQFPVFLNVGIAGHKEHNVESVFLIDKITDIDTGRHYYPSLVFTPPCPTHSLQTSSKPQFTYPPSELCDMEASSFYETATRFSSSELIQCLKIVSDNTSSPIKNIQPSQVSLLVDAHISVIASVLTELTKLAELLHTPELAEFDYLLKQYHFTVNEQIQLKKLLSRWRLTNGQNKIEFAADTAKDGKDCINLLNQYLNNATFLL